VTDETRVLCVPFVPVLGAKTRNLAMLNDLAHRIAASGEKPDLVVLPELALSGYLLENLVSEAAFVESELAEIANVLACSGVPAHTEWVIGLPLRAGGEVFNCAVVFRGGEILHLHSKLFLPTYGMFDESRYFARGSELKTYAGALGRTAMLVCEDAWHMEMAFAVSAKKAEAVIVISASPARGLTQAAEFTSSARWRHRLQTFAESYGQQYIYCNRGGVEDGVLFDGSSFVFDPLADYIAAESSGVYQAAQLYCVRNSAGMRHGFLGNSARQNDALLLKQVLSED
jgi:NAD+ synthase (glutamine-hydrolysing)